MPPVERPDTAAAVALPVPIDALFDYEVPAHLDAAARPGCRVLAPFGPRRLVGVVVARRPPPASVEFLRPLARVLDGEPALSEAMMQILREEAEEVLCPVGLALAAALPASAGTAPAPRWTLTRRGRIAVESGALRGPLRELAARLERGAAGSAALARRVPGAAALLRQLARDGLVSQEQDAGPEGGPPTERVAEVAGGVDPDRAAAGPLARAPAQARLLRRLAGSGPIPTAALSREGRGSADALRALAGRGLVEIQERPRTHDVLGQALEAPAALELTEAQATALAPIVRGVRERRHERVLLQGVTGSGKTEVYLRAVEAALDAGRQALVLVPEIPLTHQILARLRGRFGDACLAVLHSGLRPGERREQWERLRRGTTPIAVGARSALFAPLEDLGLIVIDEEHDGAYKNDEGFRYHARDLADRRARASGCPLLLGSATPSLETRHAADRGEVRLVRLPRRIGGRPLPAVEIVDLERERAVTPRGRKLILTGPLRRALRETLAAGGQALLLHNRRGFSTKIFCFDCGHAERCKHCDIALVYHAPEGDLRCHYCDYRTPPPETCPGCGAPETALLGVGTQRVEEEVRARFPEARVMRLDRDTARRRGATEAVLRALRDGEVDVVVGTQMLAKGHDFPGVRLVGVVLADLGLHLPDFRAAERTFQLLTQVAGRAGRGRLPGRVVVQTFSPQHYAVAPVRTHDYEAFCREELAQRRALDYPPFGRLAQALVSGPEPDATREAAEGLAARARDAAAARAPAALEVLGPAPAPLAKLRDRWRFHVLVKGADSRAVWQVARDLADAAARLGAPLRARLDANPLNML